MSERATYRSPPDVRARIGADVLEARSIGVPWKLLERKHGYTRARLAMLAAEARVANMQHNGGVAAKG